MCSRRRPRQPSQLRVCVGCDDPIAVRSDAKFVGSSGPTTRRYSPEGKGRRGADGAHVACRVGRPAAVRPPARRNLRRATHRWCSWFPDWQTGSPMTVANSPYPAAGTAALNASNSDSSTRRGLTLRARCFENPAETTTPPAPRSPPDLVFTVRASPPTNPRLGRKSRPATQQNPSSAPRTGRAKT